VSGRLTDTPLTCPSETELGAFHDGELEYQRHEEIASHVASCESCASFLGGLRAMSQLFAAAPRPEPSFVSMSRLQRRLDSFSDAGLLRIAWTLSGIAAAILVAGSLWLKLSDPPAPTVVQSAPPWVNVTPSADTDALALGANTPAAWYLAETVVSGEAQP